MNKIVIGEKFNCKTDYRETCFGIVVKNKKILLVKKNNQYSLIGGGIEENETHLECLEREFKEESGYKIKSAKELVCIDCFWLAAGKYPMESKANIFIVEVDELNKNKPTEQGNSMHWLNLDQAKLHLPLPYHKKAIEYYLSLKQNTN